MPTYTDYFTPDLFFVTCTTIGREPILGTSVAIHLLRMVLKRVKQSLSFRTLGYVFLPDHFHLLIKPGASGRLQALIGEMQQQYTQDYQQLLGIPGQMVVWATDYEAHKIQDQAEFAARLDYIHYNPVYHKFVQKPEGWPHSSYPVWLERGLYQAGWGSTEPERIQGKRWG